LKKTIKTHSIIKILSGRTLKMVLLPLIFRTFHGLDENFCDGSCQKTLWKNKKRFGARKLYSALW